ncbi:MAG: malonate decarboxylase subunit alpha [Halanaerobiales bacterium]|nr:malonate decarboxylase subunit alpha [Halanaerobiales bacterium]
MKVVNAKEAAYLIEDGDTVGISSMGLAGWPEEIAQEIEKRFIETGKPRDLTIKQGSACGDWKERGITRFGHQGLVKKWDAAHIGSASQMLKLVKENKIETHCLPQGVIVNLWREIAAGRPGLITKVGLHTFVDPRVEGGKMNEVTTEEVVEIIVIDGEEYLRYKPFTVDIALIRGTTADEKGNLTMRKEGFINESLALAEATKNTGGIVIAQVEYLAKAGTLHPKDVKVPGSLIDYVVKATKKEASWQTEGLYYEPSFAGEIKIPLDSIPKIPLDEKKVIARRATMELKEDMMVNLGYGMFSSSVASVAAEENCSDKIMLSAESGQFGGVPASPPNFGHSYNPEAMIDHGAMFDYYDGGGIDITFLGFAQADQTGNVNVSKFGGKLTGPGGFINITQNAQRVIFCGTFMVGAELEIKDGKVIIKKEGKIRKFKKEVEQITFSGKFSSSIKQKVFYITERGVFVLQDEELVLIEIAPGIDLKEDILRHMDFEPKISKNLKTINQTLFNSKWGNLSKYLSK